MMRFFRKHEKKLFWIVIVSGIGLTMPSLAIQFFSSFRMPWQSRDPSLWAGTLWGEDIPAGSFATLHHRVYKVERFRSGGGHPGVTEAEIWRRLAMLDRAEKLGLTVGMAELGEEVREFYRNLVAGQRVREALGPVDPQRDFQAWVQRWSEEKEQVKFDAKAYERLFQDYRRNLRGSRGATWAVSASEFELTLKEDLLIQKMESFVRRLGAPAPEELWERYLEDEHQRQARYVDVRADDFPRAPETLFEADAAAVYAILAAGDRRPETADVEWIHVPYGAPEEADAARAALEPIRTEAAKRSNILLATAAKAAASDLTVRRRSLTRAQALDEAGVGVALYDAYPTMAARGLSDLVDTGSGILLYRVARKTPGGPRARSEMEEEIRKEIDARWEAEAGLYFAAHKEQYGTEKMEEVLDRVKADLAVANEKAIAARYEAKKDTFKEPDQYRVEAIVAKDAVVAGRMGLPAEAEVIGGYVAQREARFLVEGATPGPGEAKPLEEVREEVVALARRSAAREAAVHALAKALENAGPEPDLEALAKANGLTYGVARGPRMELAEHPVIGHPFRFGREPAGADFPTPFTQYDVGRFTYRVRAHTAPGDVRLAVDYLYASEEAMKAQVTAWTSQEDRTAKIRSRVRTAIELVRVEVERAGEGADLAAIAAGQPGVELRSAPLQAVDAYRSHPDLAVAGVVEELQRRQAGEIGVGGRDGKGQFLFLVRTREEATEASWDLEYIVARYDDFVEGTAETTEEQIAEAYEREREARFLAAGPRYRSFDEIVEALIDEMRADLVREEMARVVTEAETRVREAGTKKASLADVAKGLGLEYVTRGPAPEGALLVDPLIGTPALAGVLVRLQPGDVPGEQIINDLGGTRALVRLLAREEGRLPGVEEVRDRIVKDLRREAEGEYRNHYARNQRDYRDPGDSFVLEYVRADYRRAAASATAEDAPTDEEIAAAYERRKEQYRLPVEKDDAGNPKPGAYKPLEEVKEELRLLTTGEKAARRLLDGVQEGLQAPEADFLRTARVCGEAVEYGRLEEATAYDTLTRPEIGSFSEVYNKLEGWKEGTSSGVLENDAKTGLFVLRVVKKVAAHTLPFEEVRTRVVESYWAGKAYEAARKRIETVQEAMKAGRSLAEAAADAGLTVRETGFFGRDVEDGDPGTDDDWSFRSAVFRIEEPGGVSDVAGDGKHRAYLAEYVARRAADPAGFEAKRGELKESLQSEAAGTFLSNWEIDTRLAAFGLDEAMLRESYEKNLEEKVEVRAGHILVKTEDRKRRLQAVPDTMAKEAAQAVLARAIAGEDLGGLARVESEDADTREVGGLTGLLIKDVARERYGPAVADTLYTLEAGALHPEVIKGIAGYHVLRCERIEGDRREARQILLRASPYGASEGRRKAIAAREEATRREYEDRANEIAALVRAEGADFAAIATERSEDEGSKVKGGDLGWFGKGRMVEAFWKACVGAAKGTIVGPVESEFGWHVIRIVDRREKPYAEVREALAKEFFERLRFDPAGWSWSLPKPVEKEDEDEGKG